MAPSVRGGVPMKIRISDFAIRQCEPSNLKEILKIQNEALADLPCVDILRENTMQMLKECLNQPHLTVGVWYEDILAAFSILYYPHDEKENLSIHLQSVDVNGLKTANNKLCIVRKDFRGNSLQYHLGLIVEHLAIDTGINLLCATVSPKNQYSIDNILRLGYMYNRTLNKYGFERNLYYKII